MLKVSCGTTLARHTYTIAGNTVVKPNGSTQAFDHLVTLADVAGIEGVDTTRGQMWLDGDTVVPGDMTKSFVELGITDGDHRLLNVLKADNA